MTKTMCVCARAPPPGAEGSAFANQLFLPLNGGLLIVQGLKRHGVEPPSSGAPADPEILQWHTPLAQYLGHSVVNYVSASPRLDGAASLFFRALASRGAAPHAGAAVTCPFLL